MTCGGNADEICGGFYAMSVYENDVDDGETEDPSYLGCYSNPADSRVFVQDISSAAMTAEVCSEACTGSAYYGTQSSTECWCGAEGADYDGSGAGVCDMPCGGNADEICGGFNAMSVYENAVDGGEIDDPSYLGCYSDPADSRVFVQDISSDAMTAEACSALCSASDFYGTQYSTECWCGDNVGYAANGPGVCDMSCSGNSDEICGGSYSLSIHSNDPLYIGCYVVPADNPDITVLGGVQDDMTPEVCKALCPGYRYYSVSYSDQCHCSDTIENILDLNLEGTCDMTCAGDASQICGGYYSNNIYENDVDAEDDPAYLGCYSDPADNRVFVREASSDDMTSEVCASLCVGSSFYGTQYSQECWCGDINAQYSANGEGECDMTCSGDSDEICGGSYSMDVYAQDPSYLGCFSDPADGRIFEREASSDDMTAEACATLCADSAYYGTQYSQECWCGDNADYDANGFGVCDMSCSGNSDEICGGSYAMSVYQTT
ncbi:unnamed protein product [Ectocarpus sp. 6 AP-2014]